MRRALSQFFPASTPGTSWFAQLGAASCQQGVLRSSGEVSTSYGSSVDEGLLPALVRGMSGKGAKGKGAPAAKAAAAPAPPPPPPSKPYNPALAGAGARLRRRQPGPDPLTLLTPQQRDLAELLVQRPPLPPPDEAEVAAAAVAPDAAAAAAAAAAEAAGAEAVPLRSLAQVGLPLGRSDVASLLHQSLSAAVGQNVHFQPFVFSNIFQSAPAAATYVAAALEGGANWGRVERFFLAAVEADSIVRGVRVKVTGRLGRKADMSTSKVWEWGEMSLRALSDRLDYGAAAANTRMGALGVKVWIRYKGGAVTDVFFPPMGGSHHRAAPAAGALPSLSLDELYDAAVARTTRVALPYKFSSVGWWERPAAAQPPENRVSELFVPDFDPRVGDRLDAYLRRRREERRRFRSAAERRAYMATSGRFLAKQRRMARMRVAAAAAQLSEASEAAGAPHMGRRPNRVLGRFWLETYVPARRIAALLRHQAEKQNEGTKKALDGAKAPGSRT